MTARQSFNPDVFDKLEEFGIIDQTERDAAMLYLLSVFFDLDCSCIPSDIIRRVNLTKIVERGYTAGEQAERQPASVWNIPLFTEGSSELEQNWAWIADYRKLFSDVRTSAKADLGGVLKKMKNYFAENPHVRAEDVMEAARNYVEEFKRGNGNNAAGLKYFQQADHFIYRKASRYGEAQSRLTGYLETIYEERRRNAETNTGNRFMNEMR
jgi:hypothetical protein